VRRQYTLEMKETAV